MTASSKGRKVRNRSRNWIMSPAATARLIERNIQRDTLGLGHWREPADWCTEPFSHTVTMVADVTGKKDDWQIYNSGVVVTLVVQPPEGPFVRGVPYVWCKAAHNRNGTSGVYPTAPIFGRFLSQTKGGPKALVGKGQAKVLGAEYVYCFRAVGMVGRDADLFTRSEIPVSVPSDAEWNDQPLEFDVLQHHVKTLDQLLHNMADIDDMVDDAKAHRQARAYKLVQPILTAAMQQQGEIEKQMTAFLASAPNLARHLARWQSEDAKI